MPADFLSFETVKKLLKRLVQIRSRRKKELLLIAETFENPESLAQVYVWPKCQHHNPTDYDEDEDSIPYIKSNVYEYLNQFLKGSDLLKEGRSQLFVLSDA